MNILLIIIGLTFFQKEPTFTGEYKGLAIIKDVRHIPRENLMIMKNGKYKIEYSVTSLHSKKIEFGSWEVINREIHFKPNKVNEGKHRLNDFKKIKLKCKEFEGEYFCKQRKYIYKNDTLWIDTEPRFIKE